MEIPPVELSRAVRTGQLGPVRRPGVWRERRGTDGEPVKTDGRARTAAAANERRQPKSVWFRLPAGEWAREDQ